MASLYPTIVFRIAADIDTLNYLHPDRHQTDQSLAVTQTAQHNTLRSTWLSGLLAGENVVLNNDDTFTVTGQKAVYLKDNFTSGANAFLEIVSNS